MRNFTKNIIPISELQRQAGQIVDGLSENDDPVIITQHGRAAAVMITPERYDQIQEDLRLLDDLELMQMLKEGEKSINKRDTISMKEVKKRLKFPG
jgi:prevent-host-death family protein